MTGTSRYACLTAGALFLACGSRALAQCQSDGDCRAGRVCREGNCVDLKCTKDIDCPNDGICDFGKCKSTAVPTQPIVTPEPGPILPPRPESPPAPLQADKTIHRHFGFFVRFDLGAGYGYGYENLPGVGTLSVAGLAGTAGASIGGAVIENTVLAVHVYDVVLVNPTVRLGTRSASTSDTSYWLFAVGPSVTQYLMPANIYLSGTVAVTRLSATISGTTTDFSTGYGFRAAIGKEWWVSDHWGLGLSGHLTFSSNKDNGNNAPTISSWFYGLSFSATYN